jgi:hypothetical protein
MARKDPMVIFATRGGDGKPSDSPLFAAVRVTARLCARLRLLTKVAQDHAVDTLKFRHTGSPIYWDFPLGSSLESCVEEHSQWTLDSSSVFVELWGRLQMEDGFSESQVLAVAASTDLESLEHLRSSRYEMDYVEDEDTEAALGQPFFLAVHERFVAISKLRGLDP